MKQFKIGLQLYSVRDAMAKDFEGTLKAVADMGYEYVEFAGYFGKTSEEIKALLDKYNLKCVSVHQALNFFCDDPKAAVEYLKGFGVKYNVIPWYEESKLAGTPEWESTKETFIKIAEMLKAEGMLLGYHNHEFEFKKYDGKTLHDFIFEAVPSDLIFPEIDTCWVKYADVEPVDVIRKYSGRVPVIHLKDFVANRLAGGAVYDLIGKEGGSREDNGFRYRPLGQGIQDFAPILKAMEECGTEIIIVEQDDSYEQDSLDAARASREYLRKEFGI